MPSDAALLAKTDGEVELGGGGGDRLKRGGEPRQVKADRGVALERQHHLEQRMTGQRAGRVDDLDQPFERQLLMVVGGEIGGPHTGNQVAEARIAAGVGAQHQGVDEEADQIVERTVGAARDRAADRDVGAGAQPGEQSRDTGLQHHEQAGPAVAGQTHQSLMEPRPQRQRDTVAAMAGDRRPRPVGRQLELIRKTLERAGPERQLTGHRAVRIALLAQNLVLPQRVVGILHRQRRKLRGAATAARRIGATKIAGQRAPGPAVAGDVMQHQQQHMLAARRAQTAAPAAEARWKDRSRAAAAAATKLAKLSLGRALHLEHRSRRRGFEDQLARHAERVAERWCASSRGARPGRPAQLPGPPGRARP